MVLIAVRWVPSLRLKRKLSALTTTSAAASLAQATSGLSSARMSAAWLAISRNGQNVMPSP